MKRQLQNFSNKKVSVTPPKIQQPNNNQIEMEKLPQQQQQQQQQQKPIQKTLKKIKKQFPQGARLHKLNNLYFLEEGPHNKKRFAIQFQYQDQGKIKQKTVKFGKRDIQYYIDHQDDMLRDQQLMRSRACMNPFQPNFWCNVILQQKLDPRDAYQDFMNKYKLF